MFCTNCGRELKDDTKFCPECGTRVEPVVANTENTSVKHEEPTKEEDVKESSEDVVLQEETAGEMQMMEDSEKKDALQVQAQPVEFVQLIETIEPKKQVQKAKIDWNSGLVNFAIVAGVVLLLVGTAFFISIPKEGNQNFLNGFGNGGTVVAGDDGSGNDVSDATNDNLGNGGNESTENNTNTSGSADNGQVNEETEKKKEAVLKSEERYSNGQYIGVAEYDENGNEIFSNYINEDYSWSEYTYVYDKNGNKTGQQRIEYDSDGEIEETTTGTYTYDENNNLLEVKGVSSTGSMYEEIFTYDDKNRETSYLYIGYYPTGNHYYAYRVSYEEKDRIHTTSIFFYDYDESVNDFYEVGDFEENVKKYDDNGFLIEEINISNTPYMYGRSTKEYKEYKYDEMGNLILEHSDFYEEGVLSRESDTVYEYDIKLNVCTKSTLNGITYEESVGQNYCYIITMKYDEGGNLIEEKSIYNVSTGENFENTTYYTYYE